MRLYLPHKGRTGKEAFSPNPYLRITPNNKISIVNKHSAYGQGIRHGSAPFSRTLFCGPDFFRAGAARARAVCVCVCVVCVCVVCWVRLARATENYVISAAAVMAARPARRFKAAFSTGRRKVAA